MSTPTPSLHTDRQRTFAAYQQVMREFLQLQEDAVRAYTTARSTQHPAPSTAASSPPIGNRPSAIGNNIQRLTRYVMHQQPVPLPPPKPPLTIKGQFLLTDDGGTIANSLAQRLRDAGATAAIIPMDTLLNPEALRLHVLTSIEKIGPVTAILHLAGLQVPDPKQDSLDAWHRQTAIQVKGLFHVLQVCGPDLRRAKGLVCTASLMGGAFGRNGQTGPGSLAAGGCLGLLRTARLEWPELRIKAIDFDAASLPSCTESLLSELAAATPDAPDEEIGIVAGQRHLHTSTIRPIDETSFPFSNRKSEIGNHQSPLPPNAIWLCLGGARGITAEAALELLQPGMTMVVVARGAEPATEPPAIAACPDAASLRAALLSAARADGAKPRPADIERALQRTLRDRTVKLTLDTLRTRGVRVEYHAADVCREDELGRLITDVYNRHGRIDALIHGAGIIEDKLIESKTRDSFDRVFDTKADSMFILSRYLKPDTLKLAILFSSVAGRTGNIGQCDYAATNEVMNRFAWKLRNTWPNTRVTSINWGPWESSGMASEAVNRMFRERGVIPITNAGGRRFLSDELAQGNPAEVEIVAGLFPTPS